MTQQHFRGGLAVFGALTVVFLINVLSLQSSTHGLAPAPVVASQTSDAQVAETRSDGSLVILNSADAHETALTVQRELAAQGYQPGPETTSPSLMLRAAIMAYEYDNGLPLRAVANLELLERLRGQRAPVATTEKNSGQPVSPEAKQAMLEIQQLLKQLKYEPGPVDGVYGAATKRAISDFEFDKSLPETGRVSGHLVAALNKRKKLQLSRK